MSVGDSTSDFVIIDTDIGGDIDDAYAVALALQSPEIKLLGVATTYLDPTLQARLVRRLLIDVGRADVMVATGIQMRHPAGKLTQARYAEGGPDGESYPSAVDFILGQIRSHPGKITLIGIGPLTDLGAAMDRDMATFSKVKRVIIMGGSIYRGYNLRHAGDTNLNDSYMVNNTPDPEYNIAADVPAAQRLFTSGVPLYVMPLDSTQIKMEELRRAEVFTAGTPLTDALTLLTEEWSGGTPHTPTLFDAMAVAYAVNPAICPVAPMGIRVDEHGSTVVENGAPNAYVCLHSDTDQFFDFLMPRILGPTRPSAGPVGATGTH
jgi:inosine-uridine nucleoside N-ribohydrolase